MGDTQVTELRERFERDGYVEFRVVPWKVALQFSLLAGFVVLTAWFARGEPFPGYLFLAFWIALVPFSIVTRLKRGFGPELRIDRDGMTIAGATQPFEVEWGDILAVTEFKQSRFGGSTAVVHLAMSLRESYLASRPVRLPWSGKFFRRMNAHWVPRNLDVSAKDLIGFLDDDTITRLTKVADGPQLILAPGDDGRGPLFFRNGREADLAKLPLTDASRKALTDWNLRADQVLERWEKATEADGQSPEPHVMLDGLAAESRTLATHMAHELGQGADVVVWLDSPDLM